MKRIVARLRRVALLCTPHCDARARRPSGALRVSRSMHATMRATRSRSVERARARWQRVLDARCDAERWRSVSRSESSRCKESMRVVRGAVCRPCCSCRSGRSSCSGPGPGRTGHSVRRSVQQAPVIAQVAQVRGGAAAESESFIVMQFVVQIRSGKCSSCMKLKLSPVTSDKKWHAVRGKTVDRVGWPCIRLRWLDSLGRGVKPSNLGILRSSSPIDLFNLQANRAI